MVWVCLHAVDVVQYPVRQGFGWLARSQLLFRLFSILGVASIVYCVARLCGAVVRTNFVSISVGVIPYMFVCLVF